jgi:diguanylate cyclase (GGDEF)-like protein
MTGMTAMSAMSDPWSHTVLMVADASSNTVRAVRETLAANRRGRFEVAAVPGLDQAVEALRRRAWDVLLIDLELPGERGLETLLRAQMLAHRLPIVLMTGYPDEELALRAVEAGVQEYLVTDGSGAPPPALGRTLRHAVVRHRLVDKLRRGGAGPPRPLRRGGPARQALDPETGLGSRSAFLRKLEHAVTSAQRFRERPALLRVEIADLAAMRGRLGPVPGARLLQELGRRLSWCVRRTDSLGRLGEGEMAVLLRHAATAAGIRMVAERVRLTLSAPFDLGGQSPRPRVLLGGSWYPQDGETAAHLLDAAEAALHESRALGGSCCRFFRGFDIPDWPEDVTLDLRPPQAAGSRP